MRWIVFNTELLPRSVTDTPPRSGRSTLHGGTGGASCWLPGNVWRLQSRWWRWECVRTWNVLRNLAWLKRRKWSRTSLYLSAKVYKNPAKYVRQTDIDKLPELIRKLAKSRGSYHEKRCSRTFASITTTGVPYSTENTGRRGNCTRKQHSCSSISYRSKR